MAFGKLEGFGGNPARGCSCSCCLDIRVVSISCCGDERHKNPQRALHKHNRIQFCLLSVVFSYGSVVRAHPVQHFTRDSATAAAALISSTIDRVVVCARHYLRTAVPAQDII
ncbi:unnamed protein product [Ectocarpus sp. 13 AM-2016]